MLVNILCDTWAETSSDTWWMLVLSISRNEMGGGGGVGNPLIKKTSCVLTFLTAPHVFLLDKM